MKSFLKWLATSPTASVLKIAVGGLLVIVFDSVDSLNLPTGVALAITALIPVIVDALNPQDPRFGVGKTPSLKDFLAVIDKFANELESNTNSKKP